jgi:hypothetical protein
MRRLLAFAAVSFAATLAAAAFFSAWHGQAGLNLPLLLEVGLIASFMFPEAMAVAVAAGLAIESISSPPFGLALITSIAAVAAVSKLFVRVFTDLSLLSFMTLNGLGYLIFRAVGWSLMSVSRWLDGETWADLLASADPAAALLGAVIQAFAAAACLILAKRLKRALHAKFIYAERR